MSADGVLRLRDVGQRARTTIHAPRAHATSARNTLVQFSRNRLKASARQCNERNRILSIPSAIWRRLLSFVDLYDCVSLSRTCHHLHAVVQAAPHIWLDTLEYRQIPLHAVLQLASRCSQGPLRINLTLESFLWLETGTAGASASTDELHMRASQFLSAHLSRMEALSLELYLASDDYYSWAQFCVALTHSAMELQTLQIIASFDTPCKTLPPDLFSGLAPRLTSCVLLGIQLPLEACPAFANVTTLRYQPECGHITADELLSIVDNFPRLHTLGLTIGDFKSNDDWEVSGSVPRSSRTLRSVSLQRASSGFRKLLRYLRHLNVEQLSVTKRWESMWWQRFEDNFPFITGISIGRYLCEVRAHPELLDPPVRFLVKSNDRMHIASILGTAHTHTHLVTLVIHENLWPENDPFPPAPVLISLRIWLSSCSDYRRNTNRYHNANAGIFLATTTWRVPALQSLHLAYSLTDACSRYSGRTCSCAAVLPVSLQDVFQFTSTCLIFRRRRLKSLRISGVDPIDWDADAFVGLESSADKFEMLPTSDACAELPRSIWADPLRVLDAPTSLLEVPISRSPYSSARSSNPDIESQGSGASWFNS